MKKTIFTTIWKAASIAAFLFLGFILMPAVECHASNVKKNESAKTMRSSYANPDFGFPETVEKDAMPVLKKALAERNGVDAMNAAMQVIVARNMISASSFKENVGLLDSISGLLPAPYPQLCALLEANLYKEFYVRDSWTFNNRTLPLDSYPEDVASWSGELFAKKVLELVDESFIETQLLKKIRIDEISRLLTNVEEAEESQLYVYDFMVYNSSKVLDSFSMGKGDEVIPFRKDGGSAALTFSEKCGEKRKELLSELFEYRKTAGDVPALVVAIDAMTMLKTVEENRLFLKEWISKLSDNGCVAKLFENYIPLVNNRDNYSDPGVKWIYKVMKQWLNKFPDSRYAKLTKYYISLLEMRNMNLEFPQMILPHEPAKGKVTINNMNEGWLLVYKVPEKIVPMNSIYFNSFPGSSRLVKTIRIEGNGEIPFTEKKEFTIEGLDEGYYALIPSETPKYSANWKKLNGTGSILLVNVSGIAIVTTSNSGEKDSSHIYVVDARTQKPIAGANVGIYPDNNSTKLIKSGVTDEKGMFKMPEGSYRTKVSYGKSVIWEWQDFDYYQNKETVKVDARILTSQSVYKPGDEVAFSLVGWTTENHVSSLIKEREVDVILKDANYNSVDTLTLATDRYGRCSGKFKLPESGLLGRYSLYAVFKDQKDAQSGFCSFEVAEYKTPGFIVTLEAGEGTSFEPGDTILFKGNVMTYSGMPLGDADVTFNVRFQPWWRWWNADSRNASYGGKCTTDSQGEFEITLPTENLKGTRFERGVYILQASATSLSGETQTSSDLRFSLGDGLTISPKIPQMFKAEGDTLTFNVPVYDMLQHPVVRTVDYSVRNVSTGEIVTKGSFESPVLKLSDRMLPSAEYSIQFNLPGDTLKTDANVIIYRVNDVRPPVKTPLWLPETQIVSKRGEEFVEVKAGSGFADSWILCTVSDENGYISREWLRADDSNVTVKVKAPSDNGRIWVAFCGMHDLVGKRGNVTIVPESQTEKLEVEASAFRNKISAGDKESWKFAFKTSGTMAAGIPAMAVMTNKALNAIVPFEWNFAAGNGYWSNRSSMTVMSVYNGRAYARFNRNGAYPGYFDPMPGWNAYGFDFAGNAGKYRNVRIRGLSRSADGAELMVEKQVMMSAAPTMGAVMAKNEMKYDMADDAVEEEAALDVAEPEAGNGAAGGVEKERLRPVDMPLAFFMPDLVADSEGVVNIEFETPDFNTTWQFQIIGYTDRLLTAGLIKDAVASKPVMVQSNHPRYLRTGDKAYISALLFNNSDKRMAIDGEIVIFNPMTGETILSHQSAQTEVDASGNTLVTVEFTVPSDLSAIGIKAYARGGNFSDGEQDIIPVLPSSTPVTESTQFYVGRDETSVSVKLPKFKKDANVTLKYCDNPVWECVMALPSISTPESENILSLMKALYGNSMAMNIAGKYPEVRQGIEKALKAKEEGDPEVLVSNLEKDKALKSVALENTPWVNNASSETLRMSQLGTLLDKENGEKSVFSLMDKVKSLRNDDGGWSWCKGMKSSLFMTQQVLSHFGMMKQSGCLPENTDKIVKDAIRYCDREIYDDYLKSDKNFSTISMLEYLYIRSFFEAGNGPSGFGTLKANALKKISEDWKQFGIRDKATAAMLMSRSKGYERVAPVILESLRQFASKSKSKGWWFDNLSSVNMWSKLATTTRALEAYSEVEPMAEAVDGLRQWLVLQKETEDWGSNPYTVEVINAILSSGTEWTGGGKAPEITIGGKRIDLPAGSALSGIITVSLPVSEVSGKAVSVTKGSAGPAWGGVVSQYVSPIKDVKGADCENLSIDKKIYIVEESESGVSVKESSVKVGDRVRVTMTVTCDKDMNYVALIDERSACLEPEIQTSGYANTDGLWSYREVRDTRTSFFIPFLPKGVNVISYDCYVDREGEYALGMASVQSQYSPLQVAHSTGRVIVVSQK